MVLKPKSKMKLLEKLSTGKQPIKTEEKKSLGFSVEKFMAEQMSWSPELSQEERNQDPTFMNIPKDSKIKKGELWCPYCGIVNKFRLDGFGNKRCTRCGAADNMFHVRKVNKLWK